MFSRRQLILGSGAVLAAAGATLALGAWRSRGRSAAPVASGLPLPLGSMDWRLTDHLGRGVTPQDWLGRPAMVFFGFTWCPDVCPTTLMDITLWLEELGPDAHRLNVALISVDPARDTPAVLAEYVSLFDPRITGLTGSDAAIARAAADFRVRYARVTRPDGEYTMDHTAGVFLFRPDGRAGGIIDFHEDRQFAVPKIRRVLT